MASKAKKTATSSASTTSTAETPSQPSSSTGQGRTGSPLSPTRYSRMQEKADLQNLNDRLAIYIDKVRYLEQENSRLSREVHTSQESTTREVTNVKAMYENEISEARRLLDQISREKAKIEIECRKFLKDNDELKKNYDKTLTNLTLAERNVSILETRSSDLQTKYNQAQTDRKKLADDNKALEKERDLLKQKIKDIEKELEDEILHRIDMENALQTVKEEMAFKEQMHQQQLVETRTKRSVEISAIDGRLQTEYEERLYQNLQDIREQYEADLDANRDEMKKLYEEKLKSLQAQSSRNTNTAQLALKEMQGMKTRTDSLNAKITELESNNSQLQMRVRELEQVLELERGRFMTEYTKLEEEMARLREEMARQLQEYQDLMDIKVALDLEIAAYRKLLEGEEARLNITPVSTPGGGSRATTRGTPRRTPIRAAKRKRTILEESSEEAASSNFSVTSSSSGEIQIDEVCPDGKFIKLHNKSNKEVAIGGWQLVRKVNDSLPTTFKFHRTVKVEPNGYITVWSSDANQTHEPPTNIVMKGQKWVVGDHITTTLLNATGEEMATAKHVRQQATHSSLHREQHYFPQSRYSSTSGEEIYHQQGDPRAGEERCSIM